MNPKQKMIIGMNQIWADALTHTNGNPEEARKFLLASVEATYLWHARSADAWLEDAARRN